MAGKAILFFTIEVFLALILGLTGSAYGYRDMGMSFDIPDGWNIHSSGWPSFGNMNMGDASGSLGSLSADTIRYPGALGNIGASSSISLLWIGDPGTEPEKVLAQVVVAGTYGSKGLSITSTAEGKTQVQGQEADTLDLTYNFNGVFAERKLAAWRSEGPDRLFMAPSNDPQALDRDMNLVQLGYVTSKAEYYQGNVQFKCSVLQASPK
jgi:hypothetical protein